MIVLTLAIGNWVAFPALLSTLVFSAILKDTNQTMQTVSGIIKLHTAFFFLNVVEQMEDPSADPSSPSYQISPECESKVLTTDIEAEQDARAQLRDVFLRSIFASCNKPACFLMHEKTQVEAIFVATDINIENFQVSELQTPMGVVNEALLRSSDVLSFTIDLEKK